MLVQIFKAILITSAVGSVLSIILLLLKPVTRRYFGSAWQYYAWGIVLVVMILPVTIRLPEATPSTISNVLQEIEQPFMETEVQTNTMNVQQMPTYAMIATPPEQRALNMIKDISFGITDMVCYVWLAGLILILGLNLIRYLIFLQAICKNSVIISCSGIGTNKITIRETSLIDAPLIVGFFRPVLLLPDIEMSEENMNYILMHELTHYKRHDLLYKWFAMLVNTVHWFNPFAYIVLKQIDEECEISCDLSVVANMDQKEKKDYMNTILALASQSGTNSRLFTTAMANNKNQIKRRFAMITKFKKPNKYVSVLSVITAMMVLVSTIFASGALANEMLNNKADGDVIINVFNGDSLIEFENKPFIENDEVYLPVRETLVAFGVDNDNITYENGYIQFYVYAKEPGSIVYHDQTYDFWINRLQIGSPYIYLAGYSYGSTENESMLNEPILKAGKTYAPLAFFKKLKYSAQDGFEHFFVKETHIKDGISFEINISGETTPSWITEDVAGDDGNIEVTITQLQSRDFNGWISNDNLIELKGTKGSVKLLRDMKSGLNETNQEGSLALEYIPALSNYKYCSELRFQEFRGEGYEGHRMLYEEFMSEPFGEQKAARVYFAYDELKNISDVFVQFYNRDEHNVAVFPADREYPQAVKAKENTIRYRSGFQKTNSSLSESHLFTDLGKNYENKKLDGVDFSVRSSDKSGIMLDIDIDLPALNMPSVAIYIYAYDKNGEYVGGKNSFNPYEKECFLQLIDNSIRWHNIESDVMTVTQTFEHDDIVFGDGDIVKVYDPPKGEFIHGETYRIEICIMSQDHNLLYRQMEYVTIK